MGLVGYDAGRLIERIPSTAADDTALPFLLFHRFDDVHVEPAVAPAPEPESEPEPERGVRIGAIEPQMSPKEFEAMVVAAKRYIARSSSTRAFAR
jgi:hypothetical protein